MRCVNGTYGGAWVGVVQALAGCGESCGLPILFYGNYENSACRAEQYFHNIE